MVKKMEEDKHNEDDMLFLPLLGFESAYEISASGKAIVRSLTTGRTLKVNHGGWVVLRDPSSRQPVRVLALALRPPHVNEEGDRGGRGGRRWRWLMVVVLVTLLLIAINHMINEKSEAAAMARSQTIACLRGAITYLLECLERLERMEGDARAAVAAYSWRHLYGGTRPVFYPPHHHPHWADDLNDRFWVQNNSL